VQEFDSILMYQGYSSRRRFYERTLPLLLFDSWNECSICKLRCLHQWKSKDVC